jgi:predicted nucleic acid-binding protein
VSAVRRGRLTIADSNAFAALLETLPISVDEAASRTCFHDTIGLARRYSLSAYDAAYAELAARLALPLASQDAPLRQAAAAMGIALVEGLGGPAG